jgi:integrase
MPEGISQLQPTNTILNGFNLQQFNMSYQFKNPGVVKISQRTPDQNSLIDISDEEWYWSDGGMSFSIKWNQLQILPLIKEFLKGFMVNCLAKKSPWGTYTSEASLIKAISKSELSDKFPWSKLDVLTFSIFLAKEKDRSVFYAFKSLYSWCTKQNIEGFSAEIQLLLSEQKINALRPYEKVFLSQNYLAAEQEHLIIRAVNSSTSHLDYYNLRNHVILQLCYELAPRPIQLHCLDTSDFTVVVTPSGDSYYSLQLPMAKKRTEDKPERRPRSISKQLGENILRLIQTTSLPDTNSIPLFIYSLEKKKKRIPSGVFGKIITSQLTELGFAKGGNATLLRHHLAQSLADQGAPAETIAEILGHNSTLPARAYIAATPKIAEIKARALGKNATYKRIMKMILTGEIIDRNKVHPERFVKGAIGDQYIGGIGSCGLQRDTPCPKNPIHSCYTCHKFHPFHDGEHEQVKIQLQKQAQIFLDIAEQNAQLKNNRAVLQLEKTIEAVDNVIQHIKGSNHL